MSLLKVNNPRSLLLKTDVKVEANKKIVTIKSPKNEQKKIIIDVVTPPREPKIIKVEQPTRIVVKQEIPDKPVKTSDKDLQQPSDFMKCQFKEEKDEVHEIPGEFYFESDHEVLRSNSDYQTLLKYLAILQAKKIQAVQDIEELIKCKELATKNPVKFLSDFNEQFKKLPKSQEVPKIPDVDWDKYKIPSVSHVIHKPETRYKGVPKSSTPDVEDTTREKVEGLLDCKVERNSKGQYLVRGRVFDNSKPQTFNQPWMPEEQRRLEELLVEYPSEEVEMERWKKIATCLGNRTAVQVQSRVQKYFLKLRKTGLPVPGRFKRSNNAVPGGLSRPKRPTVRGKYANSLIGSRNSSFFPDMRPNVKMTEDDLLEADESVWSVDSSGSGFCTDSNDRPTKYSLLDTNKYYIVEEDVSDEEDIDPKQYNTPAYNRLKWLKRIRREKELELREGSSSSNATLSLFVHTGYKCDGCQIEPITGGRFTCIECIESLDASIDFCLDCTVQAALDGVKVEGKPEHTRDHTLKPVRKKIISDLPQTADKDYLYLENYLDPNFVH